MNTLRVPIARLLREAHRLLGAAGVAEVLEAVVPNKSGKGCHHDDTGYPAKCTTEIRQATQGHGEHKSHHQSAKKFHKGISSRHKETSAEKDAAFKAVEKAVHALGDARQELRAKYKAAKSAVDKAKRKPGEESVHRAAMTALGDLAQARAGLEKAKVQHRMLRADYRRQERTHARATAGLETAKRLLAQRAVERERAEEAKKAEREQGRAEKAKKVEGEDDDKATVPPSTASAKSGGTNVPPEQPTDFRATFTAALQASADATRTGAFGDNKVFISHAYAEAKKSDPSLTPEAFKAALAAAHRRGDIALSRADLVSVMDPADVAASALQGSDHGLPGGEFHFIQVKPDGGRAQTQSPARPQPRDDGQTARQKKVASGLARPHEHTRDEWLPTQINVKLASAGQKAAALADHRERVQAALDAGETVPPEVLAEYPELAGGGTPAVPATPAAPAKPTTGTPHQSVLQAFRKLDSKGYNQVSLADLKDATGLSLPDLHAAVDDLRRQGVLTGSGIEANTDPRLHAAAITSGLGDKIGYVGVRQGSEQKAAELAGETGGASAASKPDEPGFTGTDALGRKWVNGELVARQEVAAPVQSKAVATEEPANAGTTTAAEPDAAGSGQRAAAAGSGGGRAELGGTDGGGNRGPARQLPAPEKRIVTARAELVQPADPALVPESLRQHLDEHQVQGAAHAIDAMDKHGGFLLADGCVAAGTRIYNPLTGEHLAIEVLMERGQPHTVLALTENGFQAVEATAPFCKGVAKLYRVKTAGGREITVTNQHRFLTPDGWRMLEDGLTVGCFLASAQDLQEYDSASAPSVRGEDGRHSMRIPEDCLGRYFGYYRLCDEQLLLTQGCGQELAPSQADAQERIQTFARADATDASLQCNRPGQCGDRLSRSNSSASANRALSVSVSRTPAAHAQQPACSLRAAGRSPGQSVFRQSTAEESRGQDSCGGSRFLCEDRRFVASNIPECGSSSSCVSSPDHQSCCHDGNHQQWSNKDVAESLSCVSPCNHSSGWDRVTSVEFVREDKFYDMQVPTYQNYLAEGLVNHNTGAGKTRQILAVAQRYAAQGKKVLVITKAEVIKPDWKKGTVSGSFANDSATMGVGVELAKGDAPLAGGKVHLSTYDRLAALKDKVDKDTVIVWDESHSLKNFGSARAKHGYEMSKAAGPVLYATATPADKPLHIAHLFRAKVFGSGKWEETYRELGMRQVDVHTPQGTIQKWEVDPKVGHAESYRRMAGLFDRMVADGLMLKREVSMEGVDIGIERLELPPESHAAMAAIEREMNKKAGEYPPGLLRAATLMHQRRQQETYKIPATVDAVKKELSEGRNVVVFASRVNESTVTGETMSGLASDNPGAPLDTGISSEGTMPLLKQALAEAGISDVLELHGGVTPKKRLQAMNDFQAGKGRVIIATVESGGTGINLDDTAGDKPRTLLMMTAPFSAVDNVQAAGRVHRLKTKSASRIRYLFGDTEVDDWNAGLIAKKMQTLGAAVQGEVGRLDPSSLDVSADEEAERIGKKQSAQEPYQWSKPLTRSSGATAGGSTTVHGDTFKHKEAIKAAGGRWDKDKGTWNVPAAVKERLRSLGLTFGDEKAAVDPAGRKVVGGQIVAPPGAAATPTEPIMVEPLIPPTAPMTAERKVAIHAAVRSLHGNNTDGARERNSVGFNQHDTTFGRQLAEQPELTDQQARAAATMLAKYHRQIDPTTMARIKKEEAPATAATPQRAALQTRKVSTVKGDRHVHSFVPNKAFWDARRANKLPSFVSVRKNDRTGDWEASIWGETPEEVAANHEKLRHLLR